MKSTEDDSYQDCNVIYSDCCFAMGKRFEKLGRKYQQLGKLELAKKLQAEAVVQLDAWRKARDEIKLAS